MIKDLINGNEIKLDDMLDIAKDLAEKAIKEREEKELTFGDGGKMDNFQRIVKGIARKYSVDNFGVERDDLEQDLWVKVIELIDSKGGIEFLDEKLVAKCLWNLAVDKYRYHRRRRDSKAEYIENAHDDSDDSFKSDDKYDKLDSGSHFQSQFDAVFIREAIDLFPKGSKERKYVVTKLYMSGEIDPETYDDDDELILPEGDNEEDILRLLGYKSRCPGSWTVKKSEMRKKIYRYLGLVDDIDQSGKTDSENNELRLKAIKNRAIDIFRESSSYYIYTKKICKDKSMKILGCKEDELIDLFKTDNSKLIVGIGHSSGKYYLMKNSPKYIGIATDEGDTLFQ